VSWGKKGGSKKGGVKSGEIGGHFPYFSFLDDEAPLPSQLCA
jgi:hypothetical protein